MMTIDNLPPCPCCGGKAERKDTIYAAGAIRTVTIRCASCGLSIERRASADKIADTRAEVMAAWTCRVPQHTGG